MSEFYWDLKDLPEFVKKELNRRTDGGLGGIRYEDSLESKYVFPYTAFVRICSNSIFDNKEGFILGGLKNSGFSSTYGFNQESATILGYDCNNRPHFIKDEKFKHRPCPGIVGVSSELSGGDGKFRIVTIKWVCWSKEQLQYMTPYFLTNGVSMSVEFGWNLVDHTSLLPIHDTPALLEYFGNKQPNNQSDKKLLDLTKRSSGNYDVSIGVVSDFDFSVRPDGGFDCITVVKNIGGYFSGVYSDTKKTEENSNPDSKNEPLRNFIKKGFNDLPKRAKELHMARRHMGNVEAEVFYPRDLINLDRISKEGRPKDYDFDNNKDVWFLSFRYLISILNNYSKIKNGTGEFFSINIDNTVIGAHPNLISNDGNVMLVPNTQSPQILALSMENRTDTKRDGRGKIVVNSSNINERDTLTVDPSYIEANRILLQQKRKFVKDVTQKGKWVYVTRLNANSIINWWKRDDPSSGEFPSTIEDSNIKKKLYYGYLKNLYVNKNVVVEAVENNNTYKDIIMDILAKMNSASGNIWDFEIVPLNPDGNNNGIMTIIDKDCSNAYKPSISTYDFKLNQLKSILKDIKFSVKSTDAVSVQTLFGKSRSEITQDINQPIYTKVKDRLIKEDTEDVQNNDRIGSDDMINSNDRIPSKETPRFFFYSKGGVTYSLVEPVQSVQLALLSTEGDNPLRYSAVQPNVTVDVVLLGISGIVNLNCFTISELPSPYGDKCFFQTQNVKHDVTSNGWITTITAGVRLRPEFYGKN